MADDLCEPQDIPFDWHGPSPDTSACLSLKSPHVDEAYG
jgi:hypothetical protein